jgi:uncharacterized protein YjbI with pentapeptide repeats
VTRKPKGLRRPPPDLIAKARDDTAAQVNRVFLTLVGTAAFCALSLLTPDSSLLAGNDKINVPFAGPVSFLGFMLLGPAVLIILRIYLQIYVEHERRLDRIARSISAARGLTLVPIKNPLMRTFIGFAFYLLLPLVMLAFFLKAAVFPDWSAALLSVAVAVVAMHLMLLLRRWSWRRRAVLSLIAAILTGGLMTSFGPWQRPFNLFRANLSEQWLIGVELKGANVAYANLTNAYLTGANLNNATINDANLSGARLGRTNLNEANLINANLSRADLFRADFTGANLTLANLTNAYLPYANLRRAYLGDANLSNANLSNANLSNANLSEANLSNANLSNANLSNANLSGANLGGANLSRAELFNANFTGAKLVEVRGLTQEQVNSTCGDRLTELPPGFAPLLRICGDEWPG